MKKAVIFDLDGTLLDTLADIADSMNEALTLMDCPPHPFDAYRHFVGDGMEMLVRRVLPREDEAMVSRCMTLMKQCYGKGWNRKTKPYDGIVPLLDELGARGITLCVLSNKPHEFTVKSVAEYLGLERFERVVGVSTETPRKPDPTGLERILAELSLTADEILYVGDTNTDMITATTVGAFAVGVDWGFRPRAELESNGADAILEHPLGLLNLLEL